MEHEFWHARWARQEIGFHEGSVNRYLHDHWSEFVRYGNETVLVPLCGKALDMWWLHDHGHGVIGVELSPVACKDFFEEAETRAHVTPGQPFTRYQHDNLELWCGDFFQLVPEDVRHVRLVYDRAALIALPPEQRREYVDHLGAILPEQAEMLLITLDYDSPTMKGPPFNVSDAEVDELYGADWEIRQITRNTLAKDHPFAKRKGLENASESVFRLSPRG